MAFASHALTGAETRYVQIEKEMLDAVEKFNQYMYMENQRLWSLTTSHCSRP